MQEVLDKLAPFGYTLESVQALQADVEQLDVLRENREKEGGDAQYATKERNTKMDELYEAANEITRLAQTRLRRRRSTIPRKTRHHRPFIIYHSYKSKAQSLQPNKGIPSPINDGVPFFRTLLHPNPVSGRRPRQGSFHSKQKIR